MNEVYKTIVLDKYNPVTLTGVDLSKPESVIKSGNILRAYSILYDENLNQVGKVIPTSFYVEDVKHFPFIKVMPITQNSEVLNNKIVLEFSACVVNAPAKTHAGETVLITYMGFYIANTTQKIDVVALEVENNFKYIEKHQPEKSIKKTVIKKVKKAKRKNVDKNK